MEDGGGERGDCIDQIHRKRLLLWGHYDGFVCACSLYCLQMSLRENVPGDHTQNLIQLLP